MSGGNHGWRPRRQHQLRRWWQQQSKRRHMQPQSRQATRRHQRTGHTPGSSPSRPDQHSQLPEDPQASKHHATVKARSRTPATNDTQLAATGATTSSTLSATRRNPGLLSTWPGVSVFRVHHSTQAVKHPVLRNLFCVLHVGIVQVWQKSAYLPRALHSGSLGTL